MKKKLMLKSKYGDGTPKVGTKEKKLDTYTKEVETTKEKTPGTKGKVTLEEGTIQRKNPGKGVEFKPKGSLATASDSYTKDRIIDPRSYKIEASEQTKARDKKLAEYKGKDISNEKPGSYLTYDTNKGKQVAGRFNKEPDTPPSYETTKQKLVQVSKKGDVKDSGGRKEVGDTLKKQGYRNIGGTYKYEKPTENKFVPESELDKHLKEGYHKASQVKDKLSMGKYADGTKSTKANTAPYSKGVITNKNPKIAPVGQKVPYHDYLKDGSNKMKAKEMKKGSKKLMMGKKKC